jgi:hypothetical protein
MSQTYYGEIATGNTPAATTVNVYAKSGKLYSKDSAGNEWCLSMGASTGILAIAQGGTAATTAAGARTNIGAAAASHSHPNTDMDEFFFFLDERQGGHASNWGTPGSTDQSVTGVNVKVKMGAIEVPLTPAQTSNSAEIVYDEAFNFTPLVFLTLGDTDRVITMYLYDNRTTGFEIRLLGDEALDRGALAVGITVNWIAFGLS